jgi:hypothetical protein
VGRTRNAPRGSRLHDWPIGVEPVGEAAGVGDFEALGGEELGGDAGAAADGAVDEQFALAGAGEEGLPSGAGAVEVAEREEGGVLGDAVGPLAGFADVYDEGLAGADAGGALTLAFFTAAVGFAACAVLPRLIRADTTPKSDEQSADGGLKRAGRGLCVSRRQTRGGRND